MPPALAAVCNITSTPDILRNLRVCLSVIRRAALSHANLIYLPEASDFIARSADVIRLTHSDENKRFINEIRQEAKRSRIWVGVGIHEPSNEKNRVYNSHLLIDANGEIVTRYHKLHLFDVDIKGGMTILESNTTVPGEALIEPVQTPLGLLGLLTCYDLRFPEVSLHLRRTGAQILTYPSAFTPRTGAAHWETLLRARAIETQCYVLASAQQGTHFPQEVNEDGKVVAGRTSYGHATIIDPWGTKITEVNDNVQDQAEEGSFAMAHIDKDWLERCRVEMPLWKQRRNDIYPEI